MWSFQFYLVLLLFHKITFIESKIKCKSCSLQISPHYFKKETFTTLSQISVPGVCLWSKQFREDDFSLELLSAFRKANKTVLTYENSLVHILPDVCFQIIMVVPILEACDGLLSDGLPITVLHNFYILVEGLWEFGAWELSQCSAQFGPARVVFVFLSDARVFSLSSPLLLPRQFKSADLNVILEPVNYMLDNLNGREVNVASFNCSPFVIFDNNNDTGKIAGIEWELLKDLSESLNFTIKLVELKGNKKWGALINGRWNGGIGLALAEGTADIGVCNIWNNLRFYQIMDFGPPVNVVSFTFVVPRPRLIQHHWQSLVNIFTFKVWSGTVVIYLVSTICYWLFCNRYIHVSPEESMLAMFGILTLTSWTTRNTDSCTRQLVTWWCVFVLLLTAVFSSSIAARLALPRYEARLDTVRQLVEGGFHWYDTNYISHDKKSTYFNMENSWQRQWEERYVFVPTARVLATLRSRAFAFPIQRWGKQLLFFTVDGLDYDRDLGDMRVMRESTVESYVSFGFAKRSPLLHICQNTLLRMKQAGLLRYLSMNVVRLHGDRYAKQLLLEKDDVNEKQLTPLTMLNLSPAFFILVVGSLISLVVFLNELQFQRQEKQKNIIPFIQ